MTFMDISALNKSPSVQRTSDITAPGSTSYSTLPLSSRAAIYPINNIGKSTHSTDNNSRLYSPYTTPSSINVENKALAQASGGPIYQHNIALTKYYHVSVTPKPRASNSMNVIA